MPRIRVGVVLLVPPPHRNEIDGLRRALGHDSLGRIPPHVTLVPPVNVRVEELPAALALLRRAAAASQAFGLALGPVTTFLPVTPVGFLAVGGDLRALRSLREAVFVPPLERHLTHPFVPHVTLVEEAPTPRLEAAVAALADYRAEFPVEGVHLLQERRDPDGVRRWVPLADATFGPPSGIGRGGYHLTLTASERPDPEALEATGCTAPPVPSAARSFTVTARLGESPVGLASGWYRAGEAHLTALGVAVPERGHGVGGHLVRAVEDHCRRAGVAWVSAVDAGTGVDELLARRGWVQPRVVPGARRRVLGWRSA